LLLDYLKQQYKQYFLSTPFKAGLPFLISKLSTVEIMNDFFDKIIDLLNHYKIPYMLSGSVAMSLYIVPRATRDFDFIVYLRQEDIAVFTENFKENYYCDKEAIADALANYGMFNIIDHASGFKADFVILKRSAFRQEEFKRKVEMDYFGRKINVVTAEDLIISKLIWIQDLQSAIQMDDIKNLCAIDILDWNYINYWLSNLKLNTFNLVKQ
jgi:hypothetical protein